jgi:hypothetical protein
MTKKLFFLTAFAVLPFPLIHPFGKVRQQHSPTQLPSGPLQKACINCHSEQTEWPLYSYLPLVSWAIEKDVAEAREHLNLSRWDQYSNDQKRDLLARIGAEVRNREMPLPRYVLLHPEARLSDADIQAIYDWTKDLRRSLRKERE